jgi:ABC-type Na+ efflux pump permease subunit
MKTATLISAIITALLMLSTMICGLWIRANNITDPSSFNFHVNCGIAAVVFSLVTLVMVIVMLARMKKRG